MDGPAGLASGASFGRWRISALRVSRFFGLQKSMTSAD
jgi:hypothetical protein